MIKEIYFPILIAFFLLSIICFEPVSFCAMAEDEKQIIQVSEDEFPNWRHWDAENGLKKNWVNYINKDPLGNIWITQDETAYIFDGYTFRTIPSPTGYRGISQNADGQIWAEDKKGIIILTGNQWVLHDLKEETDFPLQTPYIVSVKENQFYLLNQEKIIFYDAVSQTKHTAAAAADTPLQTFYSMRSDNEGLVWILGQTGIAEIQLTDVGTFHVDNWKIHYFPKEINYISPRHFYLYPNREIAVTLATENPKFRHFLHFHKDEWELKYSGNITLGWLGPNDGFWSNQLSDDATQFSLFFHTQNQKYVLESNQYNKTIYSIISNSRNQFFLCNGNGLTGFQAPLWQTDHSFPEKNERLLLAGLKDSNNTTWAASQSKLYKKSNQTWSSYEIPKQPETGILPGEIKESVGIITPGSLLEKSNGNIYVKGFRAFAEFDQKRETFQLHSHPEFSSIDDKFTFMGAHLLLPNDSLLLNVFHDEKKMNRLETFDQNQFRLTYDLSKLNTGTNIPSMIKINENTFWIITGNKLYRLQDGVLSSSPVNEELNDVPINALHRLDNGTIWIDTNDFWYLYNDTLQKKVSKKGIDRVFSFQQAENGMVWFASNQGVNRFVENSIVVNDYHEGLFNGPVNFLLKETASNYLAGGELGLKIYSGEIDLDPPDTLIPETMNSKEFTSASLIRFTFDAIDRWNYTPKDRLLYSYKLNQQEWSPFQNQSTVSLNHLPYGDHTLYVKSIDRNMNIDPTPAMLQFRIHPPWYLEPAFLVLSTIGTTLIFYFGYYAIRNHMKLLDSLHQTQRTVSLLERTKNRLNEAKTRAEKATKAKDGFLARMSHEIRTPLNGIIGNLELVDDQDLNGKNKSFIHTARISANTLIGLIGEVLDFAKIESGKFELEQQFCNLRNLFEETLAVVSIKAQEKNLVLSFAIDDELPDYVEADPVRLRQVMLNLIGNAVKFTDRGSVTANLHVHSVQNNQAVIRFEVKDTGIGFNTAKKESIFKEYEQDETSHKTAEGTGLGLAICKRIIEMMNGTIDCESHLGFGSCFWFEVPLRVADESLLDEPTHDCDKMEIPQFTLEHPILVIDDKEPNLMLAKNQLSKLNIECDIVDNGQEALRVASENSYSMILVDCSMPEMDGFEFTKQLRKIENGAAQRIPVIAMTAHVVTDIRERCLAAGMDDYLSKPVRLEQLAILLQKWFPNQIENFKQTISSVENHIPKSYTFSLDAVSQFTSLDDLDDLKRFLEVVNREIKTEYRRLLHSFESRDREAFLKHVHALKGMADSICLTPMADAMKTFLLQEDDLQWTHVQNTLPEMDALLSQLDKNIRTLKIETVQTQS